MSLENALELNTKAMGSLEAMLKTVASNQERLLVGQQAAIERIDAGKGGAKATTAAKAGTTTTKAADKPATAVKVVTDEELKAAAVAWMTAETKGKSEADAKVEKGECAKFISAILDHIGVGGKLTGPESKLDADQRKQAKFFIERYATGLPVDFNADYDFDADPRQGAAATVGDPHAAAEEDPLG